MRVIITDNFNRDYQPEYEVSSLPSKMSKEDAETIADILNKYQSSPTSSQFFTVTEDDYILSKGMEDLIDTTK